MLCWAWIDLCCRGLGPSRGVVALVGVSCQRFELGYGDGVNWFSRVESEEFVLSSSASVPGGWEVSLSSRRSGGGSAVGEWAGGWSVIHRAGGLGGGWPFAIGLKVQV